jgi:signal transduction histidine kinase
MRPKRFFWTAHPARAMLEAWPIGLAILFVLSRQVGYVSPFVLGNGLFFLCGTCGMWVVLRTRLPQRNWLRQGAWELVVGSVLSLAMVIGMRLPAYLLGWEDVWLQSTLGSTDLATLLLLSTGPGYVIARAGVRVWLFWDRLRRERMLWALTHAQLTVVVLVILIGALGLFLLPIFLQPAEPTPPGTGLLTMITERLLHTLFPAISMLAVMVMMILMAVLPPSLLVSYLVARKHTQRLEELADGARSLREGRYDTRVAVAGQDEVAQLQEGFNAMAGTLEETLQRLEVQRDTVARLLQSRRELVASVSHELRTPIATMRATLESVLSGQQEALPASLQHDLTVVEDEILRLQRLIDDLFTLSQVEVEGLALKCAPTDLAPVVQRMVDSLAPLAWNSGRVEVVAELAADLPQACVDKARLEQVLANLLRNGIRHTPPGGIVALAASAKQDAVVLQVRDTGEGIAPEDLPHIWERFYRGKNSQGWNDGPELDQDAGAGLGLALVKELTEVMGGMVCVESEVGKGSCFTLKFPNA